MEWLQKQTPILTSKQVDRLSNIFDSAGQVVFGVIVLSPIISGFDKVNIVIVILGLVATLFCWWFSIWVSNKGERL